MGHFQDLLKYTPVNHPDHETLKEALSLTQNFLSRLSLITTEAMFPVSIQCFLLSYIRHKLDYIIYYYTILSTMLSI